MFAMNYSREALLKAPDERPLGRYPAAFNTINEVFFFVPVK
jgi:hypothetical protein